MRSMTMVCVSFLVASMSLVMRIPAFPYVRLQALADPHPYLKWFRTRTNPIPYYVNPTGAVAGFEMAVVAGLTTWSAVNMTDIAYSYQGTTTSQPVGNDNKNVVNWNQTGAGFQPNVLGVCTPLYYSNTGEIIEFDIDINGTANWHTNGSDIDVETVALHESGHALGFGHEDSLPSVMQTFYWGVNRSLFQTDIDGLQYVYPGPDTSPPSIPVVRDSGAYTQLSNQLSASWSSSDPDTGIVEYKYAIGFTDYDPGAGYLVPWTSAGASTSVTRTGLLLTTGQRYYFYVRAKNGQGNWSQVGISDGIMRVSQVSTSPGIIKTYADGVAVGIQNVAVTANSANIPGRIYVEDLNRSSGIGISNAAVLSEGALVNAAGNLATSNGERILINSTIQAAGAIPPLNAFVGTAKNLASGAFNYNAATGAGQRGVDEALPGALSTIGLLVRCTGKLMDKTSDPSYAFLEDASGFQYRVAKAYLPLTSAVGDYCVVRGISSLANVSSSYRMLVIPRGQWDWIICK